MASFRFKLRLYNNFIADKWMIFTVGVVVLLPFLMALGLCYKSIHVLQDQKIFHILTSNQWHPLRGDFGFAPFIVSSLVITGLSIAIAAPVCILSAIHLVYFAPRYVFNIMLNLLPVNTSLKATIKFIVKFNCFCFWHHLRQPFSVP